jgi:magnesium chelatase family protein
MATVIRSLGIAGISGYPLGVEVSIIAGMPSTNTPGQVCSLTSFTS